MGKPLVIHGIQEYVCLVPPPCFQFTIEVSDRLVSREPRHPSQFLLQALEEPHTDTFLLHRLKRIAKLQVHPEPLTTSECPMADCAIERFAGAVDVR